MMYRCICIGQSYARVILNHVMILPNSSQRFSPVAPASKMLWWFLTNPSALSHALETKGLHLQSPCTKC